MYHRRKDASRTFHCSIVSQLREDVKDFLKINKLSVTVQPGGKSHEKGCRKLAFACVSAFSWDLTSGGRPKLLVPDAFRGQEDDLAELLQLSGDGGYS